MTLEIESNEVLLGRQPIFNRQMEAQAYELLYRGSFDNHAEIGDGNHATSQVLINTFTEFGLDKVVGDNLAFINLTRDFLVGKNPLPLPEDKVVLEVLEDIEVDDALIQGVTALSDRGFSIALDDFVYSEKWEPLLDIADYIKVEIPALSVEQIKEHVERLRPYKAKLIAEKVETEEQYRFLHELGFDMFQGYFLEKPIIMHGQGIPGNRLTILRLLSELYDKDITMDKLGDLIAQDVSMSYKILRYVNSAFFALTRKMESIQEAIVYVGLKNIRAWASLIALSNFTDRPSELLQMAMIRGRMCEELADMAGQDDLPSYFSAGLFSVLDSLLMQPMVLVLHELPLSEELKSALLHQDGDIGAALKCTQAYEHADWPRVRYQKLKATQICEIYLGAVTWAEENSKQLLQSDGG